MLANFGPLEIGVVLVIALLVFGPRRLPELGSSMGKAIRGFGHGVSGADGTPDAKAVEADGGGGEEAARANS